MRGGERSKESASNPHSLLSPLCRLLGLGEHVELRLELLQLGRRRLDVDDGDPKLGLVVCVPQVALRLLLLFLRCLILKGLFDTFQNL